MGWGLDLALALASGFTVSWCLVQRCIAAWDAWHEAVRLHARDAWIREQCMNDTFYTNLRVHSDACERVQIHANRTPFLHALSAAMQEDETPWLPAAFFAFFTVLVTRFIWKTRRRAWS